MENNIEIASMKNYYKILGIDYEASGEEIKDAYRKLVRKFHPDAAPKEDRNRFLEIQEAYETLRDWKKRKRYNNELQNQETTPEYIHPVIYPEPISDKFDLDQFSLTPEEFFVTIDRIRQHESPREFHVEIILDWEEAYQGGYLPLDIPLYIRCPDCNGHGEIFPFICSFCHGTGKVQLEKKLSIYVKPGVQDGEIYQVPLAKIGLPNAVLFIHYLVI